MCSSDLGEGSEGETKNETTVRIAADEAVLFQCGGEAVSSSAWQTRAVLQIAERHALIARREGIQDKDGLVEDADPRYAIH